METFTIARDFVPDERFGERRAAALAELDLGDVDGPVRDLVAAFNRVPQWFTLQCCYGHFVWAPGQDEHNLEPLPRDAVTPIRYRIAYVAACIEDSPRGHALRGAMADVVALDPAYVQFGSADWFWEQWPNSYVLQVEPEAQRFGDQATLDHAEALRVQAAREAFFERLRRLVAEESPVGG